MIVRTDSRNSEDEHLINSKGQVVLTPREEQTVNLVTGGLNNRESAPIVLRGLVFAKALLEH